jgi:lysophospholipase L1-like esterase
VIAVTGWTTAELADGIDHARPQGPYALVTLMIGVNDQYRGRPADAYGRELATLVARAIGFAGGRPGRVIVVSIPDWGATPFAAGRDHPAITAEIDRFNTLAHGVAEHAGTRWADVTRASRRAAQDPGLVVADGLHPSRTMYAAWAEILLPEARAALASP